MRKPIRLLLQAALVASILPCLAAETPKPATTPAAVPAPPPPLEPAALARLKVMSEFLKGQHSFSFKVVTDRETPSEGGQLLDFFGVSRVEIARPNQLRVDSKADRFGASLWYDGKTVTIYSDKSLFYGQATAPATIDETVQMIMERFQTPLPVSGFLLKDPYARMIDGVKTAFDAGVAEVDGVDCMHLAFSEADADWQVWIEEGAKPLPRRIAVTYKKVPGAPRIVAALSDWNLAPAFPTGEFTFVAPAGAKKVDWKTGQ